MVDVWKVGVTLAMTNQVSSVLSIIGKDLLGIKGQVSEVEGAFGKWGLAIGGAATAFAGAKLVEGMATLVDHGKELVHVQEQMNAAGVSQIDIADATKRSWEAAGKYGLNVVQVMDDIKEARMVFGSTEHAMDFIDPLEKMRVVLNSVTSGSGNKTADAVYQMARAGELKGLQTPEQFISYFDQMTKAITASGGKVDPGDFMKATQYGRLASKGWDENFYTKILPSMIQEMGPSQAGTALMSLFGTTVQGKVTKRSIGMMDDIGLIGDPSKVIYNKAGDPVGMNPGAIKGSDLMTRDPFHWSQEILRPLVENSLGKPVKAGDEDAIQLLGGMFGNRTSAQAIATLLLESNRINKDAGLQGQAKGLDASEDLLAKDPTAAMNNFKNSWDNLLTAFGSPLVDTAVQAMNFLADGMKKITEFAAANPATIKIVEEGIVALGIAMAGLGTAAVIAAAAALLPAGLVGAGIAALGVVITTIVGFNWKGITSTLSGAFDSIIGAITAFVDKVKAAVAGIFGGTVAQPLPGNFGKGQADPNRTDAPEANPVYGRYGHRSSFIPPPSTGGAGGTVMGNVYLHDKIVGEISGEMGRRSSGVISSASQFDGTRGMSSIDTGSI